MKEKDFKYVYGIEYSSGLLKNNGRSNQIVFSNKKLNEKDFIIVEHIDWGVFIGRILEDITDKYEKIERDAEYIYIQDIDLSSLIKKYDDKKRKEELEDKMEKKIRELDEKKKLEYYAQIDDEFRELYLEYSELENSGV